MTMAIRHPSSVEVAMAQLIWLHTHAPQVKPNGVYTLHRALSWRNLPMLQWLRDTAHAPWDDTALTTAVEAGCSQEIIAWMLDQRCPYNAADVLCAALRKYDKTLLRWLVAERHLDANLTAGDRWRLMSVANDGSWETLTWLVERDARYHCTAKMWKDAYHRRDHAQCTWLLVHDCPMPECSSASASADEEERDSDEEAEEDAAAEEEEESDEEVSVSEVDT
jgi:hypothetical protein